MGLRDRSKNRIVLDVSHSNSDDGFTYSVRQHIPLGPKRCTSSYNLVVVPLSDGIMTSIERENFNIAMDTEGRLILTRKDRKVQLVWMLYRVAACRAVKRPGVAVRAFEL